MEEDEEGEENILERKRGKTEEAGSRGGEGED